MGVQTPARPGGLGIQNPGQPSRARNICSWTLLARQSLGGPRTPVLDG